jgi:hypothetical protein
MFLRFGSDQGVDFYVIDRSSGWTIKTENSLPTGRFSSKQEAVESAIEAARKAHIRGTTTRVLTQRPDGSWQPEWTCSDAQE